MAKKSEPDLVLLAFELVAERGWARFSFAELARRAGVPLARGLRRAAGSRGAAARPRPAARRADARPATMAELDGMTPRERVFELVMRRLDAMAPYKDGLRTLAREAPRDPALLAGGLLQSSAGSAAGCSTPPGPTDGRLIDRGGPARAGRDLRAGLQGLARRRHAGHGAHAGRARPPAAAGGGDRALDPRLRPVPSSHHAPSASRGVGTHLARQ